MPSGQTQRPSRAPKGVHTVRRRLADGSVRVHHYAWRGGPRIDAEPGTDAFWRAWLAARDEARRDDSATLDGLISRYRASSEFTGLSASARRDYDSHLAAIRAHWPGAPLRFFDDRRIRAEIRSWRDTMTDTPRKADMAVAVLRRVLAWGVDQGELDHNRARGLSRLHSADRSMIIWESDELARLLAAATPRAAAAIEFAALTGLRRADVCRISWSADKGSHLSWHTGKSKGRREAVIPVLPALRALIDAQPRTCATILTTARGRPWTPDGLSTGFDKARKTCGVDKRLHDLRGTAATGFCLAGLDDREAALIMGWSEHQVAAIRARYVDRERLLKATVTRLQRAAPTRNKRKT